MNRFRCCGLSGNRRGAILVLATFCLIVVFAFAAFTIDIGYIVLTKGELQNAADAAALAAAMELSGSLDPNTVVANAQQAAVDVAAANSAGDHSSVGLVPERGDVEFGRRVWDPDTKAYQILWGLANPPFNVVKVTAHRTDDNKLPLFFAPVIGHRKANVSESAVATFQPRDIVLTLDYSASMNDDSELKSIGKLSRADIENNLRQIWEDLGSPTYGSMQFTPQRYTQSTKKLLKNLGLDKVPYPYPSGSWKDYVDYVKTSRVLSDAGYRDKYGYLTLMNYWLEKQPMASQTPDLWKVSAQPIAALKDAVEVFLDYLKSVEAADQVGLSAYTYPQGGGAKLESSLTYDLDVIESISQQRQAGHYDHYTNIGAGMQEARQELTNNARPGAHLMMVLVTDGIANRPSGTSYARRFALNEAQLAADANIKIMTVSVGLGADKALMQQIADTTGGEHFNIPGGGSVADYAQDLRDTFREIAADRPVKLIQ